MKAVRLPDRLGKLWFIRPAVPESQPTPERLQLPGCIPPPGASHEAPQAVDVCLLDPQPPCHATLSANTPATDLRMDVDSGLEGAPESGEAPSVPSEPVPEAARAPPGIIAPPSASGPRSRGHAGDPNPKVRPSRPPSWRRRRDAVRSSRMVDPATPASPLPALHLDLDMDPAAVPHRATAADPAGGSDAPLGIPAVALDPVGNRGVGDMIDGPRGNNDPHVEGSQGSLGSASRIPLVVGSCEDGAPEDFPATQVRGEVG